MAWGFVQSNTNNAIGASSLTVTYNSNVTAGNKLISQIIIAPGVLSTITSVQDAALNSETNCGEASGGTGGNTDGAIYAMDVPAGDAGTRPQIKVTYGQTADIRMIVEEFSGLAVGNTTAAMIDGTAAAVQETPVSPQSQPAYTSTASNELLFTFLGDNGNSVSWTLPTGYTADGSNTNGDPNNDLLVAWKNSTNGAESGSWVTSGTPTGSVLIVAAFKLAPSGGGVVLPQPGPRSWRARFKPPQTPYPPNPPALPPPQSPQLPQPGALSWRARFRRAQVPQWQPASALAAVVTPAPVQLPPVPRRVPSRALWRGGPVPGIQGIAPRQAPYLPPRRTPARAYWRGSAPFTGFVSVAAPHQPPYLPPRRVPARAAWKGSAPFTGFVAVPAPVQPPPTVFRRVLARAYWRGGPVPPIVSVPPRQLITIPRRKPSRAYVQFTPVATTNAAPVVPTSGTTQPWPTVPVPRRVPLRALWRGLAVPPQTGQAPRQLPPIARRVPARALWRGSAPFGGFAFVPAPRQVPPLPRRKPARAVVQFTPVATVNQVAAAVAAPRQIPTYPRRKLSRAYVQFRAVATVNAPFVPRGQPPQAPDDKGYLVKLYYLLG